MEKKKSCHVSRGLSGFSILEALFGGWLLIREDILRIFRLCKDVEYALLRYLLEDLVPLVIFFYSTIIRGSHYEEWQLAIICLSIMLITQKRRHYNKSMLAAISDFMHYEVVIPEWQTVFANHLNVFTEKKVEVFHSMLRRQCPSWATASQIAEIEKVLSAKKFYFDFLKNFSVPFTKRHHRHNISYLAGKTAEFLVDVIESIYQGGGKRCNVEVKRQ